MVKIETRRWSIIAIGIALALTSWLVPTTAKADNGVDVYTTPGYHEVNGREWSTTCEPYSQTTRCRTLIWASLQKLQPNGDVRYVRGWAFNNLTYLPSPRALWKNNPLGHNGSWTATDGKKWRTECDTPKTGRGACRSEVEAYYYVLHVDSGTGVGAWKRTNKMVFNNIVRFSS